MVHIWSYVYNITTNNDGYMQIWSKELERDYQKSHAPLLMVDQGTYVFGNMIVHMKVARTIQLPSHLSWRDIAYMNGKWHLDTR